MELVVEELDKLKRKMNITVPGDVFSQRVDNAYKELNRQVKMPGFRPGKIPQKILEQQVPLHSFSKMFQEMMQEYYEEALRETGFTPVGQPEIENTDLENIKKDAPFKFSVVLHIKPEIELIDYKGMKFKKRECRVSDEELEVSVKGVLSRYGDLVHYEDEDHKIQQGDIVMMDFEGTLKGEPLEDGSAKDYKVRVGEKKMIAGFEDQLVGHTLGEEFEVKVILPSDWNKKMRRVSLPVPGADPEKQDDLATFKVKIKEIRELVLPELSDDIAEKEGFPNVDAFRRGLKTHIQAHKEQQEELGIKEAIFNKLVKETDCKPPETLVERELKFMIEGMKFQIQQSGMKVEDSGFDPERAQEEWREKAEFNSKGYMILEAIAQQEDIHVTQKDLEEEYKKLAEQTKQKVQDVQARMMANPDSMSQTNSKILGLKAMNFIYNHCEFEYVKDEEEKPESK